MLSRLSFLHQPDDIRCPCNLLWLLYFVIKLQRPEDMR